LHPKQDPPPDNHFFGFCKVGDDKEVAVRRGKAVTIALKDCPELSLMMENFQYLRLITYLINLIKQEMLKIQK
jgi:hypothetical protein